MKLAKTALVLALASAGTMAAAESQVTLYGTIDGAVVVKQKEGTQLFLWMTVLPEAAFGDWKAAKI